MGIVGGRWRDEDWRSACGRGAAVNVAWWRGSAVTRAGCLVGLLFAVVCDCVRAGGNDGLPLELRPYQVALLVAIDVPQQSQAARDELRERIGQSAARCLGTQWNLTVDDAKW